MIVRTDCRGYRISRPCEPHKLTRVRCEACDEYDPVCERIVIVKLGAMGDVLRTTCCLPALKARYPASHITWITRANAYPLLAGNALVDRVLTVESSYLEILLAEEFDLAIGPEAEALPASIMRVAQSTTKRGFTGDGRGGLTPLNDAADGWWRMGLDDTLKRSNRRTYGEWLYGVAELPLPVARPVLHVPDETLSRASLFLREQAPEAARWVCFNTGGSGRWKEKRWRPEHYLGLAAIVAAEEPGTRILLVGGPEEADLNRQLITSCPELVDGGTSNSVEEFAALVAACDWMLTPDSLGYHVACAVNTPAACVVGPTSPWELDLFGQNRVLFAPYDCVACYKAACPLPTTCMEALTPEHVWSQLRTWSRTRILPVAPQANSGCRRARTA